MKCDEYKIANTYTCKTSIPFLFKAATKNHSISTGLARIVAEVNTVIISKFISTCLDKLHFPILKSYTTNFY